MPGPGIPGVPMLHANDNGGDVVRKSSPNKELTAAAYIVVVVY